MAVKVKELKDDAIVDIQVNKSFYYMMKSTLFYLFQQIADDKQREESLKTVMTKKYEDMDEFERSFYTITLFLAEVEKLAVEKNLYSEKDVLQEGDEGYTPPTQA